jgi:hypothetical protein
MHRVRIANWFAVNIARSVEIAIILCLCREIRTTLITSHFNGLYVIELLEIVIIQTIPSAIVEAKDYPHLFSDREARLCRSFSAVQRNVILAATQPGCSLVDAKYLARNASAHLASLLGPDFLLSSAKK